MSEDSFQVLQEFDATMRRYIAVDLDLPVAAAMLRDFREQGLTQQEAQNVLEAMRANANKAEEDRILEILDVVTGFCQVKFRVWA